MTCRHSYGDPSCSSYQSQLNRAHALVSNTPDAKKYEVLDAHREGDHLVLKIKYPNCAKCSYEGVKIMVFLDVTELDVIMWNKIDPHFRDPANLVPKSEAPSPAARFPASDEGWNDAMAYVKNKLAPEPKSRATTHSPMSNHICTADDCCTYEERQQQRKSHG